MESHAFLAMDVGLFRALNSRLASPVMDELMLGISSRWTWIVLGCVLVGFAVWKRQATLISFCLLIALAIGLADGIAYQVLKPAFKRERPCYQLEEVRLVQERCGSDYGFPSNHASNGMAVAVAAALARPRHKMLWAFFGAALVVGFSRIYLGVHFPGDVLAGFAFGAVVGAFSFCVYRATIGRWLPLTARP